MQQPTCADEVPAPPPSRDEMSFAARGDEKARHIHTLVGLLDDHVDMLGSGFMNVGTASDESGDNATAKLVLLVSAYS
jgi:hypothetical protein